jgi:diguanylate cyclase
MLNDLFINTLLLISFTFIGGHITRELPKNFRKSIFGKIMLGVSGGLVAVLMMVYAIEFPDTTTLLDLRVLSLIIISSIGGIIPTAIAAVIITVYRISRFGINFPSIIAIVNNCLYILFFYIINKKIYSSWKNWFTKLAVTVVILSCTFLYLLRNLENSYEKTFIFILVFVSAGTLEYFLYIYADYSNELYRKYKKDATIDFLTGLNNRRSFDDLLKRNFENALENKDRLSCLMIDIDYFKNINDTYGHTVGDLILKELTEILEKNCRNFDIIARVGGEEFCVLLLDCDKSRAYEIGMRIRNAVKNHNFYINERDFINITVSIGLSTYPDTVDNLEELMFEADSALYAAKKTGRDRVCD